MAWQARCAAIDWPELTATEVVTGAITPVFVTHSGDGSGRLFVVEQGGKIMVTDTNGAPLTVFLDIQDRVGFPPYSEDGLQTVAFPTNFATQKKFYVYYNRTNDQASVIARFSVSATNNNVADPGSEEQILVMEETAPTLNGGMVAFGPDGYLYVSTGDNGFDLSAQSLAQNPASLWGKMLRLDVQSTPIGYTVPPSNPYVGSPGRAPEIWSMGFRNPWRYSFDRANGDLYISDVGQFIADEINYEPAPRTGGRNYGWQAREGRHAFFEIAGSQNYVEPILEQTHGPVGDLQSTAGGFVYRGPGQARLDGMYFFGDFFSGVLQGAVRSNGVWLTSSVGAFPGLLSSFGEDQSGRLYATEYISGSIFRLDDSGRVRSPEFTPGDSPSITDQIVVTCQSPGAETHYTTNGADPLITDAVVLAGGSVTISSGTMLKARAFRGGLQPSLVASGTFVLKAARPQFSPSQGPVTNGTLIAMSSSTPGAMIRYTLDGSEPVSGSTAYASPVAFNNTQVLKARAFKSGFTDSDVATFHSAELRLSRPGLLDYGFPNRFGYLTWSSMTGQVYRLQYSPDFTYWIDASTNLTSLGSSMTYTDFNTLPNPRRGVYRVVVP